MQPTYRRIIAYFSPSPCRGIWRLCHRLRLRLLRETYALPLDALRIVVGLLCCAYFIRLLIEVADFSSPDGLLDHELYSRILWFTRLSVLHPGVGAWFFYGVFGVACLLSWGIVLGHRIKLCAAVLFVITVSSYRWNFLVFSVDDSVMHLLLFWLLLLPLGQTLTWHGWRQDPQHCWRRWSQVAVSGVAMYALLGNVCLVYLTAGLCKLSSPLWRQGFALYAILRLPIAYDPDFWGPQHHPFLQGLTYLTLVLEPLMPVLLLQRPWHPLKWCGLLVQVVFHVGILATLRVPFANLGLLASALLFFRHELMETLTRRRPSLPALRQEKRLGWRGRLIWAWLGLLLLAMLRGVPVLGVGHKPAFALLWMLGMAQDYQLFHWIDHTNYRGTYRVVTSAGHGREEPWEPRALFPVSMRGVLLQAYVFNIPWMRVPRKHRAAVKHSILTRSAQRFCRHYPSTPPVDVWIALQRLRPEEHPSPPVSERFLMTLQCVAQRAILCRTFLGDAASSACQTHPLPPE